jgi:tRNA dimethylallyltransferase
MVRAIEVFEITGEPLSQLQSQWEKETPDNDAIVIGLTWEVEAINRRINTRVKEMMDQGLLEEVLALQGTLGMQAREALGYKQLLAHISGECTLDEAIEQIKILTRRFAKQQRNWLRRFQMLPNAHFIEIGDLDAQDIVNKALTHISAT